MVRLVVLANVRGFVELPPRSPYGRCHGSNSDRPRCRAL
jgi:hypothetical protein